MSKKKKAKGNKKEKEKDKQAEVLKRWTEDHGNLTGKSFAKKLPKEAAELRNGQIDKDLLERRLTANAFHEQNMIKPQYRALAKYTIPLEGTEDLRSKFEDALERHKKSYTPEQTQKLTPLDFMEENQSCFKKACEEHMDEIVERCFQGQKDAFLEHCELYCASPERYLILANELMENTPDWKEAVYSFSSFKSHMSIALDQVERGLDRAKNKCWECDMELQKVLKCGKCDAARYCARDCQVKAWRGGHRNTCQYIKEIYENFTNNIKIVDEAHSDPEAHRKRYGIPPSSPHDYMIAGVNTHIVIYRPMTSLMFPEMDMFYKNLELVRSGQLWAIPGHIWGSQDQDKVTTIDSDSVNGLELNADLYEEFNEIASVLAFNYSADRDPSLALRGVLLSTMEDPTKVKHRMSPSQFLHIYSNLLPRTSTRHSPKSWRLEAFHFAHRKMRVMHKWCATSEQSSMHDESRALQNFRYNERHRTEVHNHFFC